MTDPGVRDCVRCENTGLVRPRVTECRVLRGPADVYDPCPVCFRGQRVAADREERDRQVRGG